MEEIMKDTNKKLVIEQLTQTLNKFNAIKDIPVPKSGWVRAIRKSLGMNITQLAKRLKVSTERISYLEKNESSGAVTISSMRKVANQLDCVFVYGIVTRESLKSTITNQAKAVAKKIIKDSSHTMLLEKQNLSKNEEQSMYDSKVTELVNTLPKYLWADL